MNFTFNDEQFHQLFPFYIAINKDLRIASHGKSLNEFIGFGVGVRFFDLFTILDQTTPIKTFDELCQQVNKPLILQINNHSTETQYGQFHYLPQTNQLLFVGGLYNQNQHTSKAKETFLANVSHEIRTPMSGVLGLTKLLSKTKLDDKQQNYIKLISESVNNLLMIVNDILDIEKISSGKIELENKAFKISNKVISTIQLFRFKAEEKHLDIVFKNNMPANLVVLGDQYRFAQILSNLLSNAVKFTHKGQITVSADLLFYSDKKLLIEFSVTDTGIGIEDEKLANIFDPFTQISSSYTRQYGGTGLGLSICKSLVEMQGGHIKVSSKANTGTTFTFSIPYERGEAGMITEEKTIDVGLNDLKDKKILIAEDVELNQFLAKNLLESWGCVVDVVDNGKDAYKKVRDGDYDIVLMDVQMPIMDGLTASRYIRNMDQPQKAKIPILAFTANALKGDNVQYIKAGMNDYISKPYAEDTLYRKIASLLDVKQPGFVKKTETKEKIREAVPAAPVAKLYDLSMLRSIGKDNEAFVEKMISLFLTLAAADFTIMKDAAARHDNAEVGRIAHKLKSSLSNIGVHSLIDLVKELENLGTSENKQDMQQMVNAFGEGLNRVLKQLAEDFPQSTSN